MIKLNRVAGAVLAIGALSAAAPAFAQEDIVQVGGVFFDIHSSATDAQGPLTPPGANLKVGNATTLGFTYLHMFDDHFGGAFLLGVPPTNDVDGKGALAPLGKISSVKSESPTFMAEYFFNQKNDTWRPYVGAGINFTKFTDAKATGSLNAALGGPTSISLENSTGLALQVGVHYNINQNWLLDANLVKADVKSKQTSTTGFIQRTQTIDFNPLVYSFNVGYRF